MFNKSKVFASQKEIRERLKEKERDDLHGEHSHPASVRLFPARLKVSKALKKKFLNDEYLSYRAYFDNLKEPQQKENLN